MPPKTEKSSTKQKDSSIEIQIQEELERYPLKSELEIESATDSEKHRQNMRNFFDSVSWVDIIALCVIQVSITRNDSLQGVWLEHHQIIFEQATHATN